MGGLLRRLLLPAATLLALAAPAPSHAAVSWGPCPEAQYQAFECASLPVPIDRSGAVGGTVPLFARRLTASGPNPNRVAVVALSGGPGQAATEGASGAAIGLAPALKERDLLVFDQRGTGRSGPLACPALERKGSTPQVVGGCARELGAARGFYRTADSVEDLEALRREAGYEKLALFGVSYGTKVALDYASRYPERVERLVLDSIVPQEGPDPLVRSSVLAIRRLLGELCGGGRCRRATPDPVGDVRRIVARRRGVRGTYVDARGRRQRASVDGSDLYGILQAGDTNPALRAQLPAAMRAAVRGDEAALLRLASTVYDDRGRRSALQVRDGGANPVLFIATICEDVRFPWARDASLQARVEQAEAALRGLSPAALRPFDASAIAGAGLLPLCIGWPNAAPEPSPPAPLPNVPALLLSGAADVRTPMEDVGAIAARLPGAIALTVPFVGHSVLGSDPRGCPEAAIAGFFNGQGVVPCQNRGPIVAPLPRSPRSLGALPRAARLPGRIGRTVTAVLRTRDDSLTQAIALGLADATRSGGLRGGTISLSSAGVRLRDVSVIEGVRVSGTFPSNRPSAQLRITGPAAARGTLTITRSSRISGTIGGRRIRLVPIGRSAAASRGPAWSVAAEVRRLRRYQLGG